MKKLLGCVAVLALTTTGCAAFGDDTGGSGDTGGGDGVRVTAATYPLAWVSERIVGDAGTVDNLTAPGTEPHDLELDIAQTALITQADLVVHQQGLQPAVDDSVEQNAVGDVVDAAAVVGLQPFDEGHDDHGHEDEDEAHDEEAHDEEAHDEGAHEDEASHDEDEAGHEEDAHDHEGELDPHFWLDPERMATLGDDLAEELSAIDPDSAEEFRANAADLRAELETLDGEYADGLASCERSTIVVSHDAFGYLAKYGVEVAPVAGLSPDAEPTPAVLADLQDLIRTDAITTVFSERLVSTRLTDALASDAGVQTAVLDPIEGLTDETSDEDYLSLMRQNLAALREANGCR